MISKRVWVMVFLRRTKEMAMIAVGSFNRPIPGAHLRSQLKTWVEKLDNPAELDLLATNPICRPETYGRSLDILKDQQVKFSPMVLGQTALQSGLTITGQALLGTPAASLALVFQDSQLLATYRDVNGQAELPVVSETLGNLKEAGFSVTLPGGQELCVASDSGLKLRVLSHNEKGQVASEFRRDASVDQVQPHFTSAGDGDWQHGLSYFWNHKGQAESLQVFDLQGSNDEGYQYGTTYNGSGKVNQEVSASKALGRPEWRPEYGSRVSFQDQEAMLKASSSAASALGYLFS